MIWVRKALVALRLLVVVVSSDARAKSRCLAMLISVRTVTPIASPTSKFARSKSLAADREGSEIGKRNRTIFVVCGRQRREKGVGGSGRVRMMKGHIR